MLAGYIYRDPDATRAILGPGLEFGGGSGHLGCGAARDDDFGTGGHEQTGDAFADARGAPGDHDRLAPQAENLDKMSFQPGHTTSRCFEDSQTRSAIAAEAACAAPERLRNCPGGTPLRLRNSLRKVAMSS